MTTDSKIDELLSLVRTISYATKFHDSIKGSFIPQDMSFSFGGGAIDYACAYVLFRIINQCRPQHMLEIGMGQSTKIFMSYIDSQTDEGIVHRVVEHDDDWIEFFSKTNPISSKTEIINLELLQDNVSINGWHGNVYYYNQFAEAVSDKKYDLIFIDGPYGWNNPKYSRIDCADLIPEILSDSFAIVLHDIYREGEKNTFAYMKSKLQKSGIEFCTTTYNNTGIIVSEDNRFLCTL